MRGRHDDAVREHGRTEVESASANTLGTHTPRPLWTTRLEVAHDVGDHAPQFHDELHFSYHTERLVFRWSTRAAGAARARWEIEGAGQVVASGEMDRVPPSGGHHFFRLDLADLARHSVYTVVLVPLSESGEALIGSNPVRLVQKGVPPGPKFGTPIEEVLESVRKEFPVPALGAAVVTRDFVQDIAVIGERAWGSGVSALVTDAWHLGSCTKAMTATLLGVLIHRGELQWDDTVGRHLSRIGRLDQ